MMPDSPARLGPNPGPRARPTMELAMTSRPLLTSLLVTAALALSVPSTTAGVSVRVTATGSVSANQVAAGPLASVAVGEAAVMSFLLDSDAFVDNTFFPTRGYVIDEASFELAFDSATAGLQDPFPTGPAPYFVLRDNDPAIDGFFISRNTGFWSGLPLDEDGQSGPFDDVLTVTYGDTLLAGLDILDALGTYDLTGLTSQSWTLDDGQTSPLSIAFESLSIETADDPWQDLGGGTVGINGPLNLVGGGTLVGGTPATLDLTNAPAGALTLAWLSFSSVPFAALGGTVHATPFSNQFLFVADGAGAVSLGITWPAGLPVGTEAWFQFFAADASVIYGLTVSNGLKATTP